MAPTLVLIAVAITAAFGKFVDAPNSVRYFFFAITAATGALSILNQYAAMREGVALITEINKLEKKSPLAESIGASRALVSLSTSAIILTGLAIAAFSAWAILGA